MTEFLIQDGSAIQWAATGGDAVITLASLANNAGRAGGKIDLGATRAELFGFRFRSKLTSAPTAGEVVRLFMAFSEDNSNFAGNVTGSDAAFSDEGELPQLQEIRSLILDGDTASQQVVGTFRTIARYVAPVVFNESGQSLSATSTDHELVVWPIEGVAVTP